MAVPKAATLSRMDSKVHLDNERDRSTDESGSAGGARASGGELSTGRDGSVAGAVASSEDS
eukprot:5555946-Pleurochrysis_carterae.AAC.1